MSTSQFDRGIMWELVMPIVLFFSIASGASYLIIEVIGLRSGPWYATIPLAICVVVLSFAIALGLNEVLYEKLGRKRNDHW